MRALIVNADDLGTHPEIDRGIIDGFRNGIVTSTTLLVTIRPDWYDSALAAKAAGLPLGLHLSLTDGKPISPPGRVPDLVDTGGAFRFSAVELIRYSWTPPSNRERLYEQIRIELEAQITALLTAGIKPTHLDSHQHVHMNPAIFRIAEDLALKHGIKSMRLVREPFILSQAMRRPLLNFQRRNQLKAVALSTLVRKISPRVKTNDFFFGVLASGNVDKDGLRDVIRRAGKSDAVWEVCVHPGYPVTNAEKSGSNFVAFYSSPWRRRELDAVLDDQLKDLVKKEAISLASYARFA